jgi:hypothetical protein
LTVHHRFSAIDTEMVRALNMLAQCLTVTAFEMKQSAAIQTFQMEMPTVTAMCVLGVGVNVTVARGVALALELALVA